MKQLILVRHAKSSWNNPSLTDHDRPLNSRGKRDAPRMAEYLYEQIHQIDVLISSTAVRAQLTAKEFKDKFEADLQHTETEEDLYHASAGEILDIVRGISDNYHSAMIFGHNPGFTQFANNYATKWIDNVPTCGIVGIDFNVRSWSELGEKNGTVIYFYYPKMFN